METRANFAMIGVIVFAGVIAFAAFALWLGQSQFNRDFDRYDVIFEGPITLETGAQVRFNGISVGEVESVMIDRTDDSKVRTRIRVNSDTPVRTDSVAEIDLAGITGATFVQIKAGSLGAPLMVRRAGEPIPVIESVPSPLAELFSGGTDVLQTATESADRFNSALSDQNLATFSDILLNIEDLTGALGSDEQLITELNATLADVRAASRAFAEASTSISELSQNLNGEVGPLSEELRLLMADVRNSVAAVNVTIDEATRTINATGELVSGPGVEAIEEVTLVGQDMRRLIDRLDRLAREFEQNPEGLLVGNPRPYEGGR